MSVEDALAVIEKVEKFKERERKEDARKGRKRERTDHQNTKGNRRKDDTSDSKIHSFSHAYYQILAQIKDEHYVKWPRRLHSSPNVRDKKKYCRFHKDHSHYTEDCKDLNEQIEELIRKRK